ncbi:hypothetical protein DFH28DRAFT_1088321 [Melampsora americana]|nr:hypothetical protein DFH28DRAFT_1088321 [Melampsora americana]
MFVWSSIDTDNVSNCSFWRVPAPQWPSLALEESDVFTSLVKGQLGDDWNGTFLVWHVVEQLWMNIQMSTVEIYEEETRKILIIFPGIETSQCNDLERHKASIAQMSDHTAMDISHFLTHPSTQHTPLSNTHALRPTAHPLSSDVYGPGTQTDPVVVDTSPAMSTPPEMNAIFRSLTPSTSGSSDQDAPDQPPSDSPADLATTDPEPAPRGAWPHGVTMSQMLKFLEATSGPTQLRIKQSWELVFGPPYVYVTSTVSHYRREQLRSYVQQFGNRSVQQGKVFFDAAWRKVDPRKADANRSTRR